MATLKLRNCDVGIFTEQQWQPDTTHTVNINQWGSMETKKELEIINQNTARMF
jgi:hypothetical protein